VIRQATPVVASLSKFSSSLQPVSDIVNGSVDNLVAILQNWSRAIQFRDGLSHVFRGEATMTPQILTSMINQLQAAGALPSLHRAAATLFALQHNGSSAAASGSRSSSASAAAPTSPAAGSSAAPAPAAASTTAAPATAAAPASSPPAQPAGGPLGSLLSYLLKP
jgi:hypothetical protein